MQWQAAVVVAFMVVPSVSALFAPLPPETPSVWILSGAEMDSAADVLDELGIEWYAYENLRMANFLATPSQALAVAERTGGRVDPNEIFELHLDRSVPTIEADRVVEATGNQRRGPSVMVVDTGVDSLHPDFQAGNLVRNVAADRTNGLVSGVQTPDVVVDEAGHGTHVAGIVAGSGASLGPNDRLRDRFMGVYSNGRIIGFQALAENTDQPSVDTAAALESFDWAMANKNQYMIRVVQNSWGLPGDVDAGHPVNQATLDLYLDGITVVFSAGNRGREPDALNRHCLLPWVLCVASVNNNGDRMPESSVAPGTASDPPYLHPDIAAPGVSITAAGSIAEADTLNIFDSLLATTPSNELYEIRSGTSMAAPHVSGVAALILAANPALSPDQVMDILVESSTALNDPLHEVGAGMLNARTAYNLAVQTTGNREAFEAGQQVKYAGERSGDPNLELDAVSVGYTDVPTGGQLLPPRSQGFSFALNFDFSEIDQDQLIIYGSMAVGGLLVIVLSVAIVMAIRRR